MCQSSLLRYVPEKARYRRQPLADRRNAWFPWLEATLAAVEIGEDDEVLLPVLWGDPQTGEPVAFPTGDGRRHVDEWLTANRRALELMDEGLRRGSFQFPEPRGPSRFDEDVLPLMNLGRTRFIRAKAFSADGDLQAAAGELAALLRMGTLVCSGDGVVVLHMVGDSMRKHAAESAAKLAERHPLPPEALETLLAAVEESLDGLQGLVQSLRVDLCCYALPDLEALPGNDDLSGLAAKVLETTPEGEDGEREGFWRNLYGLDGQGDGRLAWQRDGFLELLRGHPCPLDKPETARLMGRSVAATIARVVCPKRRSSLMSRIRQHRRLRRWRRFWTLWPRQYTSACPYFALGESEDARNRLEGLKKEYGPETFAGWDPPTNDQRLQLRRQLRRIHNPVGLLLLDWVDHQVAVQCAVQSQQKRQELKADLARRLREQG